MTKTITSNQAYIAPDASLVIIKVERNITATTQALQDMGTNEIYDEDF
ncbi:MAG: hypothetical protein J6W74_02390 [Bacteroidales bacterium]|nr:hypothetical protein [Bacteroidales bacterium]